MICQYVWGAKHMFHVLGNNARIFTTQTSKGPKWVPKRATPRFRAMVEA